MEDDEDAILVAEEGCKLGGSTGVDFGMILYFATSPCYSECCDDRCCWRFRRLQPNAKASYVMVT